MWAQENDYSHTLFHHTAGITGAQAAANSHTVFHHSANIVEAQEYERRAHVAVGGNFFKGMRIRNMLYQGTVLRPPLWYEFAHVQGTRFLANDVNG